MSESIAKNITFCPVCGDIKNTLLRDLGAVRLFLCQGCLLRYSFPMLHPGSEWYEESDIYEEVEWNVPSVSKLGERWEFSRALKNMGDSNKKVLDVGCGRGDFLKLVESRGFEVHGIDLNKKLIQVAKEKFNLRNVFVSTVEDYLEKNNETYDVVTAFEVLEHLPEPGTFVQGCFKLLQTGGRIILSVPGFHRFPHWVNSDVDLPPHHLTLWSALSLKLLLEKTGFNNVKVERKPLLLNDLMYHVVRFFPYCQTPGFFFKGLRALLKVFVFPFWFLLQTMPRSGGFTYLVVGTKA